MNSMITLVILSICATTTYQSKLDTTDVPRTSKDPNIDQSILSVTDKDLITIERKLNPDNLRNHPHNAKNYIQNTSEGKYRDCKSSRLGLDYTGQTSSGAFGHECLPWSVASDAYPTLVSKSVFHINI